jgi:uncharacterized membrane protein
MEYGEISQFLKRVVGALGRCVLLAVALPLVPVLIFNLPLAPALALITSGFMIEYGAAPIGIALRLPPLFVFYVLMCTETGIFLGLFDIFDTIGSASVPVTRFLEMTQQLARRSKVMERYGIYGLIPCEILIGVYFCAPVSRVMGWREYPALTITIAGYCVALIVTILATLGIIRFLRL